ncbi:uncharacterized protein [Eucyclogobius newberryi]|uniref:uncharacterized protein n=1 Tax=Eucyclogobius newberryi TaxID=166745 RepID=UPI003B5A0FDD
MAEQGTGYDLTRLEQQLQTLLSRFTYKDLQTDSKPFCSRFCKLVEYYVSRWKVPLPQLRILERAFCCFTQASVFFTLNCDHVLRTLSSLALSIFELLLFFDQKDFYQDPLQKITVTFQECCSGLSKYQNVHLLQVERFLKSGGPWANKTLHAILSESSLPQTEVEECISSEPPVFLELRVRYLLSCQRLSEAQALAKCCAQHPSVGQHLFFYQVYLTGLYKAAHHEGLLEELADFRGKDAVHFLCSLESEEKDELLLGFSRAFLSLQLRRGDMHFLCDLVSIWGRLHSRLKTSKAVLLEECERLILSAANVNAIFPFIRVLIYELSEDGVQFCVELCANALRSCLPCDVITKSLIYKTMASLMPQDLEICRACALLVFFLERSVEAYKRVYILYMHPDQEYYVDCCPIGNRVRFETLQALKKDLYFDPEFWNLIALRTNCLKLMNEKVLSAALEEIMEEKWVPNYCRKEAILSSSKSKCTKENAGAKKKNKHKGDHQHHKGTKYKDKAPAKKVGRPRINKHLPLKKKGNHGAKQWKNTSSEPMRRSSLWHLDRSHHNRALDYRENRRTTRLSERTPAKRMIRTPKWLLEDSGTLDKNAPLERRPYLSLPYLPLRKRTVASKDDTKEKVKSEINLENEKKRPKEVPVDSQTASTAPQVVLELSMPDNELLATFTNEPCNRHSGLPQRLFYKPTLKVPSETLPERASYRDEVILKAQDAASFFQMLHCYAPKPKGKKIWTKTQCSSSTITCSSGQIDASKTVQLSDKPTVEMKVTILSQRPQVTDAILKSSREECELHEKTSVTNDAEAANEPKVTRSASLAAVVESAEELEVKVAAQKNRHSPRLEKTHTTEHITSTTSKMPSPEKTKDQIISSLPPISTNEEPAHQSSTVTSNVTENSPIGPKDKSPVEDGSIPDLEDKNIDSQIRMDNTNNLSCLTLETEVKTKMAQNQQDRKHAVEVNRVPTGSKDVEDDVKSLPKSALPLNSTLEYDGCDPTEPECEESKLEFCCHFCHKEIKGRLLVAHAMFHYRKDECMFCGVIFRSNLKAMIHMSNHLEKLKKLQNPAAIKSPDKSSTRDKHKTGKVKTSGKLKTVLEEKGRGKEKKPTPPVRKLRSGSKFRPTMKQDKDISKDLRSKAVLAKVNGHIGTRKDNVRNSLITKTRLRQRSGEMDTNIESDHSPCEPPEVEKEEPSVNSCELKDKRKSILIKQAESNKNIDFQEKLCCPVDGCQWFTVKKQVALFVYHGLEDHYSDTSPLELAFSMTNNKCSICKRVLYSFEHFQHHVERHRFVPRHPCPHKGCTARFKTTIEMRRHARKHSPLQAMCCLPGCPKLFICLWQLILHEKDHYSKRSTAPRHDEPEKTQAKQDKKEDQTIKNKSNKKVSSISIYKSHSNDTNKTKYFTGPKKKFSAQSAVATRLLQRFRNRQFAKNNLAQQVTHKMVTSVGKPKNKLRHSLQKKGNKSKEGLSSKVLPQRQAKNSQNNHDKSVESEKESRASIVHQRKEEKNNTDGIQTRPEGKVKDPQKVAGISSTRKPEKRKTSLPNSEKTKSAANAENLAVSVTSHVTEENANMLQTNLIDSMAPVRDTRSSKDTSDELEQTTCSEETLSIMANSTREEPTLVQHVEVENLTTESSEKQMSFRAEKCEPEAAAEIEHLELEKNSSETIALNHTTIVNADILNEVVLEKVTEDEISNMAATVFSSIPPSNPPVEPNVAPPQNAAESRVGTTEPPDLTTVQPKAEFMQDLNKENVPKKRADASMGKTNDTAFESMTEMKTHEKITTDLMLDKMESTHLAASDQHVPSSALTSKTEQCKGPESTTAEGDSMEIFETSVGVEKRNRPKLGNKNDILSALKTLVKSKKDKIENECKDGASKRKKEVVNAAVSIKVKSETPTIEVASASAVPTSTSEGKTVPNPNPSADSASTLNVNRTPTEKGKGVKRRRTNIVDVKVKSRSTNKGVKKKSKIEKKTKNTIKNDKQQSTAQQIVTKTSTYPEVSSSSEVNGEPNPTEAYSSTEEAANSKSKYVDRDVKPKVPKKEKDETCLKDQTIYDFVVPVEEESPLATFEKALSEYKKKPYMRLPATAYLEEKFTVMPKRRKDMSMFFGSSRKVQKSPEATAQVLLQRQRCANCFTTFSSDHELQWHLQQKCSNLFGFDSDEEGENPQVYRGQRGPQRGQRGPGPKRTADGPKGTAEGPKGTQSGQRGPQRG